MFSFINKKNKKILSFVLFSLALNSLPINGIYAGRSGLSRKEAMQASRTAIKYENIRAIQAKRNAKNLAIKAAIENLRLAIEKQKQESVQSKKSYRSCHKASSRSIMKSTVACVFIMALLFQALPMANCAMLDNQLAPLADKADIFWHNVEQFHDDSPKLSKVIMPAGTVITKTAIGAVVGAVVAGGGATIFTGGTATLPAMITGGLVSGEASLVKALGDEAKGVIIGTAAELLAPGQVERFIEEGIYKFSPMLMALDSKLTAEKAVPLARLFAMAGLSSAELTSFIKGTHLHSYAQIDFGRINFGFNEIIKYPAKTLDRAVESALRDFGLIGSSGSSLQDAAKKALGFGESILKKDAKSAVMHGFDLGEHSSFIPTIENGFKFTGQQSQAFKQQASSDRHYDFMGDARRYAQHEAYQTWRAEASDRLHLPKTPSMFDPSYSAWVGANLNLEGWGGKEAMLHAHRDFVSQHARPMMPAFISPPVYKDFEECCSYAEFIDNNRSVFQGIVAEAEKYKSQIGEIHFPVIPNTTARCEDGMSQYMGLRSREDVENRNKASVGEFKNFLEEFEKKRLEFHQRIDIYNERVNKSNTRNKAIEIIKDIKEVLEGLNSPGNLVNKALKVFLKKTAEEYFVQSYEDIKDAFATLKFIKEFVAGNQLARGLKPKSPLSEIVIDKAQMGEHFLELFRENVNSILVARSILEKFVYGRFSKEIKKAAKTLITLLDAKDAKKISPSDFATSLAELITKALRTNDDYDYIFSRLTELESSFLFQPIGRNLQYLMARKDAHSQFICTAGGICGAEIDCLSSFVKGKSDFERDHRWFIGGNYPVNTAQDLFSFIRPKGKFIGDIYIQEIGGEQEVTNPPGTNSETTIIRSLRGGQKEASEMFDFFAKDHRVRDVYDSTVGDTYAYKKIVLSDNTEIKFYQITENNEYVIEISNIPAWILNNKIELRFIPQLASPSTIFMEKLNQEKRELQEKFNDEFSKLSDEDKHILLDLYDQVMEDFEE